MRKQTTIVLELQQLASGKTEDISDLLRKALLVATKLQLVDFQKWLKNELNGYKKDRIPSYRNGRGEIKLQNPYHGLIPVAFESSKIGEIFCNFEIRESIGSLEAVIANSEKTSYLTFPLNNEMTKYLMKQQGIAQLPPVRVTTKSKINSILAIVQNTILEWALKLEGQGILGDGLSFSPDEKERASGNMEIKIENFQGILGDVVNSTVTQTLTQEISKGDIGSLNEYLKSLDIKQEEIDELNLAIESDPEPENPTEFGEKVNGWIGKMISKTVSGTWKVATETIRDTSLFNHQLCSLKIDKLAKALRILTLASLPKSNIGVGPGVILLGLVLFQFGEGWLRGLRRTPKLVGSSRE